MYCISFCFDLRCDCFPLYRIGFTISISNTYVVYTLMGLSRNDFCPTWSKLMRLFRRLAVQPLIFVLLWSIFLLHQAIFWENYETHFCHCEPRNECGVNSTKQSHFRLYNTLNYEIPLPPPFLKGDTISSLCKREVGRDFREAHIQFTSATWGKIF